MPVSLERFLWHNKELVNHSTAVLLAHQVLHALRGALHASVEMLCRKQSGVF